MNEMVERVARAICASLEEDPDASDTPYEIRGWRLHISTARAALAATRASTDATADDLLALARDIEKSFVIEVASGDREPSARLTARGREWIVAGLRLQAMIDEALKE